MARLAVKLAKIAKLAKTCFELLSKPSCPMLTDAQIESAILQLVAKRGPAKSCCPSEIARSLAPLDWREQMEDVRRIASQLVAKGLIEITQGGQPVDPAKVKGAVRLRLKCQ